MKNIFDRLLVGTIVCNSCGRRIKPNLEDVEQEDGSAVRQFQCQRCGALYVVALITKRGVQLAAELQSIELSAPDAKRAIAKLRKQLKGEVRRP